MEFGKKHYILFIFIVVISPIVISQVLRIPTLDLTIGTEESWVSFFGSYLGSMIGGIITLFVFLGTINYYRKKDREDNNIRETQNRLSIIPHIQIIQVDNDRKDLFSKIFIGKINNREKYCEYISYFELKNVGLGTIINMEINASQEINSNVVSVSGICLAVGQSHKFELTMDIPLIEGIHEVSCKIEYYDLLRNKYEQEIKLGSRVDKELPNKNLQIVDVTSPIHISNKHA